MINSSNMKPYPVNKLAKLAGVSVRTLHLYDQTGLLKPAVRTEAGYRLYGEAELLRLQQILFYKALGFPLNEIREVLDDPEFDLVQALESHRKALTARQQHLGVLVQTIDKTLLHLEHKRIIMNHAELYEGLSGEQAAAWRAEAADQWGEDTVSRSEQALSQLSKSEIAALKAETDDVTRQLFALRGASPADGAVQAAVARHYALIRKWWGTSQLSDTQAEAYAGLGQLYLSDGRFTRVNGQPQPEYAQFLAAAMQHFVEKNLKGGEDEEAASYKP